MYGAIQLVGKVITVWLLGTTALAKTGMAKPEAQASEYQLYALACLLYGQALLLIMQFPINDRLENWNEAITAFCQGSFFVVLATTAECESPDGNFLNLINLVALGVCAAAALKGQVMNMKKRFNQAAKHLKMSAAALLGICRDGEECSAWPLKSEIYFNHYLHLVGEDSIQPAIFRKESLQETARAIEMAAEAKLNSWPVQ